MTKRINMEERMFTQEQIDALPTILDVVEKISAIENKLALRFVNQIPSPEHLDEGRFSFVSERSNRMIVRLMPTSQSPFKYYRGQSKFYEPCIPTIYRGKKKGEKSTWDDMAGNIIKICEFILLLGTHPVYCDLAQNILVNPVALAQHYGLATEYLDITNSKWVAAFFASTAYNWNTDTYYPVGRDYEDGYGVMYISKDYDNGILPEEFFEKNGVIGYQYFDRPTKQSSFGYGMFIDEDFNNSPYFDKVFFKHDIEASKIVFDMAYKQNRFIPQDTLSKLARQISTSNEVTRNAVEMCQKNYFSNKIPSLLEDVCAKKGWKIREDNTPIAKFDEVELVADWKNWMEFGKIDIQTRTLPIRAVTEFKFK